MITDTGFIIHLKNINDRSILVKVFSEDNGVISAFAKKGSTKLDKYKYQIGNYVDLNLTIKNCGNYNSIEISNKENFFSSFFENKFFLILFNSSISILNNILAENENTTNIYKAFKNIMFSFKENNKFILLNYIDFLQHIINYIGIHINVDICQLDNKQAFFISPKTGNSISYELGEKYKNKLFIIPKCFKTINFDIIDTINAINILHYFIYKFCHDNDINRKYTQIKFFKNELIKYLKNEK